MLFRDEYNFLSNFYPCSITYNGILYPSVENFYQAMKTTDVSLRIKISKMIPGKAKRLAKDIKIRKDWDEIKVQVMNYGLEQKFSKPDFKEKLSKINDKIVEENYWHDNFWGDCICGKCEKKGKNVLGKMLMNIKSKYGKSN